VKRRYREITCAITGTTTAHPDGELLIATGQRPQRSGLTTHRLDTYGHQQCRDVHGARADADLDRSTSGSRTGTNPHPVTLTGTNLTGATAVSVSGTSSRAPSRGRRRPPRHRELQHLEYRSDGNRAVSVTTPIGTTNT